MTNEITRCMFRAHEFLLTNLNELLNFHSLTLVGGKTKWSFEQYYFRHVFSPCRCPAINPLFIYLMTSSNKQLLINKKLILTFDMTILRQEPREMTLSPLVKGEV